MHPSRELEGTDGPIHQHDASSVVRPSVRAFCLIFRDRSHYGQVPGSLTTCMMVMVDAVSSVTSTGLRAGGRAEATERLVKIATKGMRWMPWQQEATKDAGACDKPRGAGKHAMIRGCPNGETRRPSWAVTSFGWGQRGELKHLSTRRKGNQLRLRK